MTIQASIEQVAGILVRERLRFQDQRPSGPGSRTLRAHGARNVRHLGGVGGQRYGALLEDYEEAEVEDE